MSKKATSQGLHAEALDMFSKLERVIDNLKGMDDGDAINALLNIEDWLGQLSGRAHICDSRFRYVRVAANN